LFLFISCTNTNDNDETPDNPAGAGSNTGDNTGNVPSRELTMQDLYFFRPPYRSINIGLPFPVKINPVTQTVTRICIDPLCDDKRGCPLFEANALYVTGNYVVYSKGYLTTAPGSDELLYPIMVCVYDMINGTVRELTGYTESVIVVAVTGNYFYYSVPEYDKESDSTSYTLYRADAVSGSVIEIPDPRSGQKGYLIDIHIFDGKIYWWDLIDGSWSSVRLTTDLDGNNKEIAPAHLGLSLLGHRGQYHDGYTYFTYTNLGSRGSVGDPPQTRYESWRGRRNNDLYRIIFDSADYSADHELLAESVIDYKIAGDKIYFMFLEDEPEAIEYGGEALWWNWSGGKIWLMNLDGTDKRLLADTGYNLSDSLPGFHGIFEAKTIDGVDYIAVSYTMIEYYGPDWYFLFPSPDTIIINGSTGEWVVLSAPE
jgi:hypothetical protein